MWDEYDDQAKPLDPAKRLTNGGGLRADALEKALQIKYGGLSLPDRSSSSYVTNEQPTDSINVDGNQQMRGHIGSGSYSEPAAPKSYDGPGYSDDYAVKAGGAAGSTTRLANRKTHGGLDPSLGSDQSERDFLRSQYDRSESDWRDQHPDMTMTNGAGQSFTMAQSRPRMRADAAMSQLQMLRDKIAADAGREHVRAGDTIAANKSAAEISALNATTAGTVAANEREKMKADRDQKQYDLEEGLRKMVNEGKISRQQAQNIHEAEMAKIAPTPQEEMDQTNLAAIPSDLYKDDPSSKAAILKAMLKSRRISPDISSALTAPRPGESVQRVQNGTANNFEANASLENLSNIASAAGKRSGLSNMLSDTADAVNDIPGGSLLTGLVGGGAAMAGLGIGANAGGMKTGGGDKIRSAFSDHVDTLLKSRIATDRESAIRATVSSLLTKMPSETNAQQQARQYVMTMAKEMLQQESANSQQTPGATSGGAPPMPSGQEYRF